MEHGGDAGSRRFGATGAIAETETSPRANNRDPQEQTSNHENQLRASRTVSSPNGRYAEDNRGRNGGGLAEKRNHGVAGPSTTPDISDEKNEGVAKTAKGNGDSANSTSNSSASASNEEEDDSPDDLAGIQKVVSKMFGHSRQGSQEESVRHAGLVWKNLTVRGVGAGATLQNTISDIFLGIPRFLWGALRHGCRGMRRKPSRTILDDFTGCVKPGEMLLVLGQPGSGCSTLLKVLGNQRAGYESIEGDVTYGGTDAKTMGDKYRSEVLYNPEDDLHYAALTVRETLSFALKTRTPGKESRKSGESRAEYRRTFLGSVAKLFWIEHCLDTKVGNNLIRGVSGGEKKRVSIAEALLTKASIQCWDNSTRGLDASTALEYVQSLRSLTNMADVSTLVAIYQASENLYNLFDKVILLTEGKCAYFGPTSEARAYFEGLGFDPPPRWTTADFLTSVTEPHARRAKPGWEDRIPRSAEDFKDAYMRSEAYQATLASTAEFEREMESQAQEREIARSKAPKKNFTVPFYYQVIALAQRQFLVMLGDKQSLFGKWAVITFLAVITGSLFYDLPQNAQGVFTRGGVIFFMILFNALLAMAELTATFESRPIILKHKHFSFYRPSAYALALVVVDVPAVFIQVTIFTVIVYFMAHLERTASQFFIDFLFLWLITMTMYSFFRMIGTLCGSLDVATRITGLAVQALVVYTGYLIPPRKMRPWLKWLIWINPVQYTFEAMISNEFYKLQLDCVPPFVVPDGPNAVPGYQSCLIMGSQPGQTTVNGADYIMANFSYSRDHLWRNFGIVIAWLVLFIAVSMFGAELQTSSRRASHGGASVTVYKRGHVPAPVKQDMENTKTGQKEDEETGKRQNGPVPPNETESGSSSDGKQVQGIAENAAVFTWQDVNYTIPYKGGQKKLLQDVQGYVKPGRLTAMVGASGAGKTTLLNALAQRIQLGTITGKFLIDGKPLPKSFQRATGFAEQADIHEPTATVREALRFSAFLRRPKDVPLKEKYDYCEKIIELLELQQIAGATIGHTGAGLNQEQRKRVTIAVELASKPELLLFLDEPTSGLDSLAAFNIVRFLRKLADAGQAVLCTIHQPSAVLFEQFDDLLLLQAGGRVVYHGDLGSDSRKLLDYFEKNGARECLPRENPAEYMLDVIGAGNPDYDGQNWGDVWANSSERREVTEEIGRIVSSWQSTTVVGGSYGENEFAMPVWSQVLATVQRSFVAYWRTPDYAVGKFMLQIWTGLFNTFTFWHIRNSSIDMQSRLFSIFMTLVIAPPLIQQLQPRFIHFRGLYESREAMSKVYSWFALITSAILPELPYSVVSGTVYFCCWYFGTWFPRHSFVVGYSWMMMMLFSVFYVGLGQMIASFSPNELLASLLVPAFFTFVMSFCGVVVPPANIPTFWRRWMYWLTPFHYLLEGFLGVITNRVPVQCDEEEYARFSPPPGMTCEEYAGPFTQLRGGYVTTGSDWLCAFCQYANGNEFSEGFSVYYYHRWRNYAILFSFVIFNFLAIYTLSWIYLIGGPRLKRWFHSKRMKQVKDKRA